MLIAFLAVIAWKKILGFGKKSTLPDKLTTHKNTTIATVVFLIIYDPDLKPGILHLQTYEVTHSLAIQTAVFDKNARFYCAYWSKIYQVCRESKRSTFWKLIFAHFVSICTNALAQKNSCQSQIFSNHKSFQR